MYVECIGGASRRQHRRVDVDLYSKSMTAYLYGVVFFLAALVGVDVHIYMLIYMFACMHVCMYKCGDFEKH